MELDWNILKPQERLTLQLRMLYERSGFRQYHMSRFEEYGLYQKNRSFLPSEQVITFTDLDGRLLALKPDVTLSIAKNAQVEPQGCGRYYYPARKATPSRKSARSVWSVSARWMTASRPKRFPWPCRAWPCPGGPLPWRRATWDLWPVFWTP